MPSGNWEGTTNSQGSKSRENEDAAARRRAVRVGERRGGALRTFPVGASHNDLKKGKKEGKGGLL